MLDAATGTLFVGDLVFDAAPADDRRLGARLDRRCSTRLAGRPDVARIVPGHGAADAALAGGRARRRATISPRWSRRPAPRSRAARASARRRRRLGAELRGDWLLFDVFNPRNATAVYRELEWE